MRRAAPEAESVGVTVALETHDAFSSARRVGAILEAVGSTHVQAIWDVHHPYRVGESVEEVMHAFGGIAHIAHVHVKDARRSVKSSHADRSLSPSSRSGSDGPEWELVPVGEGDVPVAAALEALRTYGYHGYVSVEWEKKWHPEIAEPEVALPQHIAWLRSHAG